MIELYNQGLLLELGLLICLENSTIYEIRVVYIKIMGGEFAMYALKLLS